MRNPLGSEAAAFRLLLLATPTLVAVTTVAILGGARAALLLCAAIALAAAAYYGRPRQRRLLRTAPAHVGPPHERRLLVLAQTALPDDRLEEIRRRADRVLVVSAPEVRSVRRWSSDVHGARAEAQRRVDAIVSRLRLMQAKADGTVGDDDPLQAIEDALRTFGGDEIVVARRTDGRSASLSERIRERFALPTTDLV